MKSLRDYQENAIEYATKWLEYKSAPAIISLPTGSGKSHVIVALAEHYYNQGRRVAIIAHRKELLVQNGGKLTIPHGYCSAQLGDKDLTSQVIVGGIQSIYNKQFQPFDIIICDECHRIPNSDDGQYWRFIKASPNAKLIGLTATPYRLKGGKLEWGEIVYSVDYETLRKQGYLATITNKVKASLDLSSVKISAGDYHLDELSHYMQDPKLIESAIKNILAHDRKSVIIFCVSVAHATLLTRAMIENGLDVSLISGDTPQERRDSILNDFRSGKLHYLVNCEILLEGFDAPCIDMIVCLRPTKSKGLWEQMLGRGVRLHESKENCLLIDMAGNLAEHGILGSPFIGKSDREAPKSKGKICPICETFCKTNDSQCPDCAFQFPPPEISKANHEHDADTGDYSPTPPESYMVTNVTYSEHINKKKNTRSIKITYHCPEAKYGAINEWIAPWSESDWARNKAWQFFKERGKVIYVDKQNDIRFYDATTLLFYCASLKKPREITVDYNEKYPRVTGYKWHEEKSGGLDTAASSVVVADLLDGDFIPF